MTISKRMAAALMAGDQYRTKKYLYSLGVNMYGQEIVQRVEIDSEGHRGRAAPFSCSLECKLL